MGSSIFPLHIMYNKKNVFNENAFLVLKVEEELLLFALFHSHAIEEKSGKIFFLFYIHRIVNVRITCLQLPPSFHKKSPLIFVHQL